MTYYTWDYRNRLVEVKQESSTGTVLNDEKFTYDVFNNRIAVSLNGTPQLYTVYDGSNPYMDFNGSGQLTERYLYNPNALSQFDGQVNASGTVQWFLTDNINSVRQVVSASGNVLDAITYDPYGNILSQTNAANAPRFLYAGGAYDSLTSYDQFGRRYYDPSDGRWTSQDPLGLQPDSNSYRYTYNAPLDNIDESGLWTFSFGLGGELSLLFLHFNVSFGVNIGYSGQDGLSFGISASGGAQFGLGLGASVGATVTVTNANNVGQLNGGSTAVGGGAGIGLASFGGAGVFGPGYSGGQVSIGVGPGAGIYLGDSQTTSMWWHF